MWQQLGLAGYRGKGMLTYYSGMIMLEQDSTLPGQGGGRGERWILALGRKKKFVELKPYKFMPMPEIEKSSSAMSSYSIKGKCWHLG